MQHTEKKADTVPPSRTDWDRLRSMTDEDIQRGIDNDPDSAPALTLEEIRSQYKPAPARIKR